MQNEAAWFGNIETLIGGLVTAGLAISGFIWRVLWKIGQLDMAVKVQREDYDKTTAAAAAALIKTSESIESLRNEHHALRTLAAAQPTRQDLREGLGEAESRINARLDRLSGQVDRLVESRMPRH